MGNVSDVSAYGANLGKRFEKFVFCGLTAGGAAWEGRVFQNPWLTFLILVVLFGVIFSEEIEDFFKK